MLAPLGALGMAPDIALTQALLTIFTTSVVLAAVFYGVARADLAGLVRYIPFPVMAGFLASTGWLMASGALNIIAGMPLSRAWERFVADPLQPELCAGLGVAGALFFLAPRISKAMLIRQPRWLWR